VRDSKTIEVQKVDSGMSVMTSADVRTIHHVKVDGKLQQGRVQPDYIICAEPSPDIARAVATALDIGASLSMEGLPSGISPEAAAAISKARAESVAQLTERLATIQLLRDTLYRACEAYANGAISDTAYTVILSRYDDIMITMLLGEFAAGGFGRTLATLGTEAGGKGVGLPKVQENLKENPEAAKLGDSQKEPAKGPEGGEGPRAEAGSFAKALTVSAAGAITPNQNQEIVRTLARMQRKYMENINSDAIEIVCITEFTKNSNSETRLGKFCKDIMPIIVKFRTKMLFGILERSRAEKENAEKKGRISELIMEAKEYIKELKELLEEAAKLDISKTSGPNVENE
jgi:hypothetical protein